MHWLGSTVKEAVLRYEVHGGEVLELKQGGFVVRGFLWCAAKGEPQLDARYKKVHLLEKCDWPDQETRDIVSAGGRVVGENKGTGCPCQWRGSPIY